jgi:hypothetical protein
MQTLPQDVGVLSLPSFAGKALPLLFRIIKIMKACPTSCMMKKEKYIGVTIIEAASHPCQKNTLYI